MDRHVRSAAGRPGPRAARRRGLAGALRNLGLSGSVVACLAPALLGLSPLQTRAQPAATGEPAAAGAAGPALAPSPAVQGVVELVQRAAEAVRQQGEGAFEAFRRPGGPWFQGDRYVVVLGSDGRSVVYPPDQRGEGLNYADFEDLGGKPFGRQFLAVGDSLSGRGWVHYQWRRPNPADRRPVWKATYLERVAAPSGRGYLVLSGLYEPPMEPLFVVEAVEGAAQLLQSQGRQAFAALRNPQGPFFYQDTYVFVLAANGQLLLNPAFPALEGQNVKSWVGPQERANASRALQTALQTVLRSDSTWTTYPWPRPGTTAAVERKTTYLRKVVAPDGELLVVGSGFYEMP